MIMEGLIDYFSNGINWLVVLFVLCVAGYYVFVSVRSRMRLQAVKRTLKELEEKGKSLEAEYIKKAQELERVMAERKKFVPRSAEKK